jgi:putative transposase
LREILDAVFYVVRGGCTWRLLPHDFPPWKTVYHYFRAWRIDGTWERLHEEALRRRARVHLGRDPQPSAGIVDSQSVKTTGVKGKGKDWAKKVLGLRVEVVWSPSRWVWVREDQGPPPSWPGFTVLPRRWVVERTFSWIDQNRRLSKDYEKLTATSEAFVYVAMSRLMVKRLARS